MDKKESPVLIAYVRKRLKSIVIISFISLLCGLGLSYVIPHTYLSSVMVLPADQKNAGMGLASLLSGSLPGGLGGMLPGSDAKNSFLSPEIVLSRSLAESIVTSKALDTFALFSDIPNEERVEAIQEALNIDTRRSGIVIIEAQWGTKFFPGSVEKRNASVIASIIANKASAGIDALIKNKSMTSAKRARIFIDTLMAQNRKSLDSAYLAMQEFQQKNKVLELENQAKALVESAVAAGAELSKAQIELSVAEQQYQSDAPAIALLQKKVSSLRNQYGKVQNGGIANDAFSIPFAKLPALSKIYVNMLRDIKIMEQINAYLQSQRTQEYIQEIRDVPAIQIIEAGIPARKQLSPKRLVFAFLTMCAGLVLAFGFSIFHSLQSTQSVIRED
jgi:capsule polysaccharide export protein KpsE/RkpR